MVFNETDCYLLEGGSNEKEFKENMKKSKEEDYEWPKMKFEYKLTKIDKKDYVVRTNHGHFLPWTGYQKNSDDLDQIKSRKSSETRHNTVVKNLKNANTIDEMLNAISDISNKNTQLNPVRRGDYNNKKMLKTTGQLCLIPKQRELIYIPLWSNFDAENFVKVNDSKTKCFFTLKAFNPVSEESCFFEYCNFKMIEEAIK